MASLILRRPLNTFVNKNVRYQIKQNIQMTVRRRAATDSKAAANAQKIEQTWMQYFTR